MDDIIAHLIMASALSFHMTTTHDEMSGKSYYLRYDNFHALREFFSKKYGGPAFHDIVRSVNRELCR